MSQGAPEPGAGHPFIDPLASVQMPVASTDVFISYASQDVAFAGELVEALERWGLKCWIAPRDVKAGALYADAIVRAINGATALVLVLSESAIASSHVGKEIERASSKKRPIITLRIDAAPLTPALEYFLSESHWIEARAGNMEAAAARVSDALREPDHAGARISPALHPTTAPIDHLKRRRNRILLGAGIAFVAVAALLTNRFWNSTRLTQEKSVATLPAPAGVPAPPAVSERSVAVLPFVDMSEKHDQEYFADGMAEETLDLLAKIPGLTVIGRTSSFQFKGKNADLRTIGAQLNAAHVLEGSVRKSGDQVRITAQLINTRTGTHEWSETYDRHIDDVLKLQDAIAAAVVRELQLTVASERLGSRSTVKNNEAYDLMLRGRHAADRFDKEGLDEAATLFQQALDRDPTSAEATAALAWTYDAQGEWSFLAPLIAFEKARREAAAALRLDPNSVLAHYVLGRIHFAYDWDWAAAEREFNQVAKLVPGKGDAIDSEAVLSMALGRWDDALRQVNAALTQDPLDPPSLYILTELQMHRGHLPEAEDAMRRALDIRPTMGGGHFLLGRVMLERGDRDAALREMEQETTDDGQQEGLAIVYYSLGRKAASDVALDRLLKEHADANAFEIAEVYAFRGQSDEAMQWLERAYVQKDAGLYFLKVEFPQEALAADPRFKAFLRKMNLPE